MNAHENIYTKAWERSDKTGADHYLARGYPLAEAAARDAVDSARKAAQGVFLRWQWFKDRLTWVGHGHG